MLRSRRQPSAQLAIKDLSLKSPIHKPAVSSDYSFEGANKENTLTQADYRMAHGMRDSEPKSLPIADHNGLLATKASSSLASSAFHASGILPQYDGAGRSHTSHLRHQHCASLPHRQAKVNLPSGTIYEDRAPPLDAMSRDLSNGPQPQQSQQTLRRSRPSASFGLDGSADYTPETTSTSSAAGKGTENNDKFGDEKPVTEADFLQSRPKPSDPEHFKEVDRFFANIAQNEQEHIARRLRQNTKTD